jgi:hypothetical protein
MSPNVKVLFDQACASSPEFARHWENIKARLRFTAHVEGVEDGRFESGTRMWSAAGDEERGLPRVRLLYRVVGSAVQIRVASIG